MIKCPLNQKRLTNVAIVRMKTHGKRFEIACYKNKVLNWREGIEKDLAEVIQIDTVFENVSKGIAAKEKDLQKAFDTTDNEEICRRILKNGELQVSDREREVHLESLFRDIVQIVAERCVHTHTGRQHTPSAVESALKSCGFSVQPDHAAKKQALKAIERLCTEQPESFSRAQMRLRILCPEASKEAVRRQVDAANARVEEEGNFDSHTYAITFVCDPRQYRELDKFTTAAGDATSLQIVTAAVVADASTMAAAAAEPIGLSTAVKAPQGYPAAAADAAAGAPAAGKPEAAKKAMKCSNCDASFENAAEYRAHCKSEWHNFNLKRKVKSLPPVSEEEFAEISLDSREGFHGGD
eukprot:TRINITY_DN21417_c0_g1_i1.p1 TRINITY_DN21417_c0_g1~~TRINITY_DN21417_c0_g1_i1.p1  ORF type:complete len:353 (+),score=88.61 TRINITY_DN21417_c0_g1_i1:90-1148(+)